MNRRRLSIEEARDLVKEHGSQDAAAEAYGIGTTTLSRWLSPSYDQRNRDYQFEEYHSNPQYRTKKIIRENKQKMVQLQEGLGE